MYSVYRRGRGFEVDYEMNDNNNAYQRAGNNTERCKDGLNQNVENSSGRSGMFG
jgi:hypothetical protein